MIKTKILKALPYWFLSLTILISLQTGTFLLSTDLARSNIIEAQNKPKVLGASTDLRGGASAPELVIKKTTDPDLSKVSAKSFLVFDLTTGQTLLEKNPDQKLQIASLTKLMTGFVAYQTADLNKTFILSPKDVFNVKPNLGFVVGDEVKALDVFNAMLIGSCNDAAIALADYVSESTNKNFISLMNQQAKTLGMASSSFSNAMGFDSDNNYSTANDLKILISKTQNLSSFSDLGRRTTYSFSGNLNKPYFTVATNKLIKTHPDIQAIKTGFTLGAAGAMATKIELGSHQIAILVLDSQNREGDTLSLKDEIVKNFSLE